MEEDRSQKDAKEYEVANRGRRCSASAGKHVLVYLF